MWNTCEFPTGEYGLGVTKLPTAQPVKKNEVPPLSPQLIDFHGLRLVFFEPFGSTGRLLAALGRWQGCILDQEGKSGSDHCVYTVAMRRCPRSAAVQQPCST